uniref:ADP-sugar pyrophosphatase n=1 Tax=Clandestinovirus TaxID=2831644 RepID=A0A8F8KRE9_9VIRU|nr:ADP-sugar pyrophosphatase [Clandestinovirus]
MSHKKQTKGKKGSYKKGSNNNNQQHHKTAVKEGTFSIIQEPFEQDERPLASQFDNEGDEESDISIQRVDIVKPWKPRTFDIEFSCIENYHSASILAYIIEPGTGLKKFLMGEERRGWSNFGGRRSTGEFDPAITAIREYCEETRYVLDPPKDMRMLCSSRGHVLYYGSFDQEPDLDRLHNAPIDFSTEKTRYAWVYGKDFLHSVLNSRPGSSLPVIAHGQNNESYIIEIIRVLAEEFRDIDPTLII